jgi:hypothetical protein
MESVTIGRFSTPLEDYSKAIHKIKTLQDVRDIESKYAPFLDDAEPCFASINADNFEFFKKQLHLCFGNSDTLPTDEWLDQFSAIPLPKLFIDLSPGLACGMGSGFVINRLLDEKMAVIEDGRFKILSPADS